MKKSALIIFMTMAICSANAQLKVENTGTVKIGSFTPSSAQVNVRSTRTNILAIRQGTPSGIAPVLEGVCLISNSQWAMGVRGSAEGSNGAVNCGLWGNASETTSNKAYGVFGSIDSSKGAAIYGQAYPWTSSSGIALTAPYAGFFDGNVHIQGVLSSSGTMLTLSPNPSEILAESLSSKNANSFNTASKLQAVNIQSYYRSKPMQRDYPIVTDKDFAGMDSLEIVNRKKILAELEGVKDVIADQIDKKRHYGFNVDQLEEVFPDLVYEHEDGSKSINYVEMIPILVQAINELSAKVEALESGDGSFKKIETRAATNIAESGENVTMLVLGQNKPNPFGTSTSIEVSLPNDVKSAFIYVYDLTGKKLQQIDIPSRGKQTVNLNASSLVDGMYLYSLIADGKVVETRRMIVDK